MIARQSLLRKVSQLELQLNAQRNNKQEVLGQLQDDPGQMMSLAGMDPDPWQQEVLGSDQSRMLLLASRQSGKSSVAVALGLLVALLQPHAPVLLLSPSMRQSGELFRKVTDLFNALGRPAIVRAESALRIEFANGSRVVSLPGAEGTIRGFSGVALLIIDEAAGVSDALYYSVRPMLAVSQGRLVALSTPFGKRGWFHDEWHNDTPWQRVRITAEECPRIFKAFLEEERQALGERWYRQEYLCSFESTTDAVFAYEDIQAALSDEVQPLFDNYGE